MFPQARVIASWYASSAGAQRLGFAKLWLFDNSLGDGAAAALAPLIGEHRLLQPHAAAVLALCFFCFTRQASTDHQLQTASIVVNHLQLYASAVAPTSA